MSEDGAIQNIYKKMEREKALITAANVMRASTTNEAVRSRLDNQMREARRNLTFFEDSLRDIQMRKVGQGIDNLALNNPSDPDSYGSAPQPPPKDASGGYGETSTMGSMGFSQVGDLAPPRPHAEPGGAVPKARPHFTKLGQFHLLMGVSCITR
jgi:hypothetical protein